MGLKKHFSAIKESILRLNGLISYYFAKSDNYGIFVDFPLFTLI